MGRRWWVVAFLVLASVAVLQPVAAAPEPAAGEGATPARIVGLRIKRGTLNAGQDDIGAFHILGEVLNASNKKVLLPQVEVRLIGANGQVFRTIPAYTSCIFYMRPRDVAPFDVQFFEPKPIKDFQISVKGIVSNRQAMRGVSFSDLEFSIVPAGPLAGFIQVGGIIRNRSRFDYLFPEVCVAGVNAQGKFVIVGQVPTATLQLPRGQINTFQGQVGAYPVPTAAGVRFYVKVCTEDDVVDFGCGG